MVIEIKHYQLKNILIKLDHTYIINVKSNIINDLKKSDTWKIQLTIAINFISPKDTDEEHIMNSKNDNIELMIYDNADEVIEKLFESLLNRIRTRLETSMRGSDFIFDCVHFFVLQMS